MPAIPRDHRLESSTALLKEGYTFIGARCARLHTDVFQARLLLQNTLCLYGEEAARLFYDETRFQRANATPRMLLKTLLGQGGVQALDDAEHRHRKQLFVQVLDEPGVAAMVRLAEGYWWKAMRRWPGQPQVVLLDEVRLILTRAVCQWAGVPLGEDEVETRCGQLVAMIEGAGTVGTRHFQARHARKEAEAWAAELVGQVREGRLTVDGARALAAVADHRELDGSLLSPHIAAVELLNFLRPTMAVARFIVFAALQLHLHPQWRPRLRQEDRWLEPFTQEVRRHHAFFPFVAGRVRKHFEWRGFPFREGTRVLLDLYGTNHDPRNWAEPEAFRPERFLRWDDNPFSFITQGGGDAVTQHRCPGERLAIELMKMSLRMLAREMNYQVPEQDLSVDLSHMPAGPASGFIITGVRPV